jgi:hypothetical protein
MTARARSTAYPFLHQWDAARYPAAYLRRALVERDVVDACVLMLRRVYRAEVTIIDAGYARGRGRAARIIASVGGDPRLLRGSASQMEAGIADLAVTFPGGRAGWWEMKRPAWLAPSKATGRLVQRRAPGQPTQEQLLFLERQRRAGAIVGVAWGETDIRAAIQAQGAAA